MQTLERGKGNAIETQNQAFHKDELLECYAQALTYVAQIFVCVFFIAALFYPLIK
mgnify:CR=1 FL=1